MKYLVILFLWLCGFIIALIIGFLDYEIKSIRQLFEMQNLPVIIFLSVILWAFYLGAYESLRHFKAKIFFPVLIILSGLVALFVWDFASHATTELGQIRNYFLILLFFLFLFSVPVIIANQIEIQIKSKT